mmetsp:Transcript_53044/g.137241  ORF Transcript_53044/g.137241 Transcript_53044/m.137241 type:complete len:214 (+) Transcript_53044:984-1625(+)
MLPSANEDLAAAQRPAELVCKLEAFLLVGAPSIGFLSVVSVQRPRERFPLGLRLGSLLLLGSSGSMVGQLPLHLRIQRCRSARGVISGFWLNVVKRSTPFCRTPSICSGFRLLVLGRSATFLPHQLALHLALRLELDLLLQLPLRGVPAAALSLCRACLNMHGRCAVRAHRVKLLFPPPGLCTLPRTLHLFGARLRSRRAEGALEDLGPAGYV